MRLVFLLHIVLLSVLSLGLHARSFLPSLQFKTLAMKDGLPDNSVKCIFDDRDGFLWYGTKNGLARYDGARFTVFKNNPADSLSLPEDFVYCITQLYDGRIAVGGANGSLSLLSPQFVFDRTPEAKLSLLNVRSAVTSVVQSADSLVWIATQSDGLFVYNPATTSVSPFVLPQVSRTDKQMHLTDLSIISNVLYIASDASYLLKVDIRTHKVNAIELTSDKISVQSFGSRLFASGDSALWISTERNGIYHYSLLQNTVSQYTAPDIDAVQSIVTDLAVVNDSVLLVSHDGGGISAHLLYSDSYRRITPNEFVFNSLPTGAIWDMHIARTGDLHVGTYSHGISTTGLEQSSVTCVSKNSENGKLLTDNSILSIVNISDQYSLFSTDGGGLYRYDLQDHIIVPIPSGQPNPSVIKTLYQDGNKLYGGSYGEGLFFISANQSMHLADLQKQLRGKSVWSISRDSSGNIWSGTLYDGIFKTSSAGVLHHTAGVSPDSLPANMINALACDARGNVWVGTEGAGPRYFDGNTFLMPSGWDSYKTVVYSICILPANQVAVSYKNFGFDIFQLNDSGYIAKKRSLLGNISVKSLLYDEQWGLFCASDKEVLLLDTAYAVVRRWSSSDGISSGGFNNASMSINGDYLLVGSVAGLNVISLDGDASSAHSARVNVSAISFYRDHNLYSISPVSWLFSANDTIALNYSDVDLRFELAKMDKSGSSVHFVYRIPGLIDEWTAVPANYIVTLPFLKGGEYNLEFATDADSAHGYVQSLHLSVKRPYWQEKWFVASCIFSLIFMLFCVYIYRDFSHRELETMLQHKVDERTLYIMQQNRRLEDNSKLLIAKNALLHEQKIVLEEQKAMLDESHAKINDRNDILEQQQEELERVNLELVLQQKEIAHQASILSEKNKLLTKSLNYAKRIQDSLFPADSFLKAHLPQSFVFFHPKEIVSGDFFWMKEVDGKLIVAEVDCTGHGVPGAFMSMIGNAFLNEIVINRRVLDPAEIFYCLNEELMRIFGLGDFDAEAQDDGMDLSLLVIDFDTQTVRFASAMQNIYVIYPESVEVYSGDIFSIGGLMARFKSPVYTVHELPISPGMKFILASDGYIDQFGGLHKEKYGAERFVHMLNRVKSYSCDEIAEEFDHDFKTWLQERSQLDDVLVVGLEL